MITKTVYQDVNVYILTWESDPLLEPLVAIRGSAVDAASSFSLRGDWLANRGCFFVFSRVSM